MKKDKNEYKNTQDMSGRLCFRFIPKYKQQ